MEEFEHTTCSFIVRLWTDVEDDPHPKTWRGRVRHIPSGAQYYFDNLERLSEIVAIYLAEMGVVVPRNISAGSGETADRRGEDRND